MPFEIKLAIILTMVPLTLIFLNRMAEQGESNKHIIRAIILAAYLLGFIVGIIIYSL